MERYPAHRGDGEPERGGLDPGVPQFTTVTEVTGLAVRGHTRDMADQSAPIFVDTVAASDGVMDGRCTRCIARPVIMPLPDDGGVLLVLEHQSGCAHLAELVRKANGR